MKKTNESMLMKAALGDSISYSSGNFTVGDYKVSTTDFYSNWHTWYPAYPTYPTYITTTTYDKPNAFELAFKIVTKMLEKKIIEKLTVKQLIETVNEVAKLV